MFIETGAFDDCVLEVCSLNPPFQSAQWLGQLVEKLVADVCNHIRLGRCCVAKDWWNGDLLLAGNGSDGLGAVEIIWAKIMAPF